MVNIKRDFINYLWKSDSLSGIHPLRGRLAQRESVSFTPRGSGVQIPHRPPVKPLSDPDTWVTERTGDKGDTPFS